MAATNSSGLSMQDIIRQRVGLSIKPIAQPAEPLDDDDVMEDDAVPNHPNYVCKCCRKCEEFVPKRSEHSKDPKNESGPSKSKSKGHLSGKRKLVNSEEEADEEEADLPSGSICATCGCTLIHHLADAWEVENDANDEDYIAEYGEYDEF